MPRFLGADFVLGGGVTLLAGVLRFVRLNQPRGIIPLDEFYYPVNALGLLRHGVDQGLVKGSTLPAACSSVHLEPVFAVHPPVGKWMIGAGMKTFGCNAFGWRVSAAIVGTLSVLLVYLIARRLLGKPWIATLAAFLVALDGLHFVQSRIGMLDIFEAFWIILALWLFVEDTVRARNPKGGGRPGFIGWLAGLRWWRIGAGIAIGMGAATKWSVVPLLPIFALLAVFFEFTRLRSRDHSLDHAFAAMEITPAGLERGEGEGSAVPMEHGLASPGAGEGDLAPGDEPIASDDGEQVADGAEGPVDQPPMPPWAPTVPPPPMPPLPAWQDEPTRPPAGPPPRVARPLGKQALFIVITFLLIPVIVYVASYTPWFLASKAERYTPPRCGATSPEFKGTWFKPTSDPFDWKVWNWSLWPKSWKSWVCYQREIFDFHKNLKNFDDKGKPTHPYLARAWSWPWIGRPTSHYFDTIDPCSTSTPSATTSSPSGASTLSVNESGAIRPAQPEPCKIEAEILGLPNVVFWFPAMFLAIPLCAWWAIRRRDHVSAMMLLFFGGLFLPWLVTTRPLFMFYMTPAVAILALMTAHAVGRAVEEFGPWKLVAFFGLAFLLPFTPLYIQWLGTGRAITLLYKVPTVMVLTLVAAGIASLFAFDPKPRRLVYAYAGLVTAAFIYFYPVLAAAHIPDGGVLGWRHHMWLQRDCQIQVVRIKLTCWI